MLNSVDVFVNKLRSTVSTTVSNINNILPGNPVTRDYEITGSTASAGPGLLWKVYSGYKKSTKEEASIFVLEKKSLDKYGKKDRELILDTLRKGVTQLTKIRHPSILTVQHSLEESRDSLAFATEPVFASLANIYGRYDNIETPVPEGLVKFEFFDLEITYGVLQISEGLAFLHNDAKILHRNISPENIIVNKKGSWKLAGFDFSVQPINPNDFPLRYPTLILANYGSDFPAVALPNLDYLAPEFITLPGSAEPSLSSGVDMFSLGSLVYYVFTKGKPLLPAGASLNSMNSSRVKQLSCLPPETFLSIPNGLQHHLKYLLNIDPGMRLDANKFSKLEFFDDIRIRTLQYLDSLFQFDDLERSKFYKGLPAILKEMPKRIRLDRVFQSLTKEFVNPEMVSFVLPSVFLISQELSGDEFVNNILPHLAVVFQMKQPIQIPILLLENMELLLKKLQANQDCIKSHLLPILCCCLENSYQVVELCLATLPTVAHLIDNSSMKNSIIPRIRKLCSNSPQMSTRVKCLLCIANLLPFFDKWLVLDDIVPYLTSISTKEPAIIMGIIGILKLVLASDKLGLTKEVMATKVIPYLMPLSIENNLSSQQFICVISIVKEMVTLVEKEHKGKLEQLENMKSQRDSALIKYTPPTEIKPAISDFYFQTEPEITLLEEDSKPKAIEYSSSISESNPIFQEFCPRESNFDIKSPPTSNFSQNKTVKSSPSLASQKSPKDLTSSLIDSNLRNMSLSTASSANLNNEGLSQTKNLPVLNYSPLSGNILNGPVSTTSAMYRPPTAPNHLNSYICQPQSTGSSLDNLPLPGLSNLNSGLPLNNMLKPSVLNPATTNNQQGINKLSKSDLQEFLS